MHKWLPSLVAVFWLPGFGFVPDCTLDATTCKLDKLLYIHVTATRRGECPRSLAGQNGLPYLQSLLVASGVGWAWSCLPGVSRLHPLACGSYPRLVARTPLWSCQATALPSHLQTGDAWTSQVWQCLGHHASPRSLGGTFNLWSARQLNTLGLRALLSTTSFQHFFLAQPGYMALIRYPMRLSFGKCSCLSASCSAWIRGISWIAQCSWAGVIHTPPPSVCAALSLVRHPQPMSRNAAGPAQCAAPAAIARTSAPASGDCSVCDTRSLCLQSVWHPQPMPAQCDLSAALACNVCNTRNHWFAMHDTRAWSATCLRHQPWRGCIASGLFDEACSALACWSAKLNGLRDRRRPPYVSGTNPGEAALLLDISTRLAVHLHAEVPNSMGCVTIFGLHMWTYVMAAAGPDQPPITLTYLRFGTFALLRRAHLGVTSSFCAKF